MKKTIPIILFSILLTIIVFIAYLKFNNSEHPVGIQIDKTKYPITGIDISSYSGKADFEKLKQEVNLDFVFLRSGSGENRKDELFEVNYSNAVKNDFKVGFYHYFSFSEDPIKQAEFFLNQVSGKIQTFPLVIDVEDWGNENTSKSRNEIIESIKSFINTIENKMKKKVMIYTNESGYDTYIKNQITEQKIWICSFKKTSKINDNWTFWQHSHKGRYNSIEGEVDINTFNGNRKEWTQFLNK